MDTREQSHQIAGLQSEFTALSKWVDPMLVALIHAAMHDRNQLRSRLKPLNSRHSYLTRECDRIADEVDGCQRALELTARWASDDQSANRLPDSRRIRVRLEQRAHEVIELQRDLRLIDEQIELIDVAIATVQADLVVTLEQAVDVGKTSRRVSTERFVRVREARLNALLESESGAMWSPSPVLGYRMWSLNSRGFVGHRSPWPKSSFTATCSNGPDVPHTDGRCAGVAFGCGVYVAKNLSELLGEFSVVERFDIAVGLVALSGKVVEHEHGYRAETTRVLSLALLDRFRMTFIEGSANVESTFADRGRKMQLVGYQENRPSGTDQIEDSLVRFFAKAAKEAEEWT
jgi:hypothetical protein